MRRFYPSCYFPKPCDAAINCLRHNTFKQADRGLFAGKQLIFGSYRTEMRNKITRKWKPNTHRVLLYSEALAQKIPVKLTSEALTKVDNSGGLDTYILNQRLLESKKAFRLKSQIMLAKLWKEINGEH